MPGRQVQVAIVGTGFAGLGMAVTLRRRGVRDFLLFERAGEVGGTWRDNTYPGCACDIRSDLYSFSFAPNPDWSHRFARQPEILAYLQGVARRFGLEPHIRLHHDLERAEWDETEGLWRLQTSGGAYSARVLVSGHGPLVAPSWPDLPGLEGFPGPRIHTARWDHTAELRGRRVAVIGTGASAVQLIPELQRVAAQVTVFQRTPPWVLPRLDAATSPGRRALFRRVPVLQRAARAWDFAFAEAQHLTFTNALAGRLGETLARAHLAWQVRDPALRARLTPDYRLGCKRILLSDDYYPALSRPNVELVTEAITRLRGDALETADGRARHFDVLIGATGFEATRPPIAGRLFGHGGRSLAEAWTPHGQALRGTTVAGFPNLFLLAGPNTALGHNSLVYIIEAQLDYVWQALAYLDAGQLGALEPREEAQRAYNAGLERRFRNSVWLRGGCRSYYLDSGGHNSFLWPGRAAEFRAAVRRFDPAEYHGRLSPYRPTPLRT